MTRLQKNFIMVASFLSATIITASAPVAAGTITTFLGALAISLAAFSMLSVMVNHWPDLQSDHPRGNLHRVRQRPIVIERERPEPTKVVVLEQSNPVVFSQPTVTKRVQTTPTGQKIPSSAVNVKQTHESFIPKPTETAAGTKIPATATHVQRSVKSVEEKRPVSKEPTRKPGESYLGNAAIIRKPEGDTVLDSTAPKLSGKAIIRGPKQ